MPNWQACIEGRAQVGAVGVQRASRVVQLAGRARQLRNKVLHLHPVDGDDHVAFEDPHFRERDMIVAVDGVKMQNLVARLSRTPGSLRHAGRPLDADGPDLRAALDAGLPVWQPRPDEG